MSELILTGFHAVEERVRNASVNKDTVSSMQILSLLSLRLMVKLLMTLQKILVMQKEIIVEL